MLTFYYWLELEVPIFPRTTTSISITIKEEPRDEFDSRTRNLLLHDYQELVEEEEIDELEEDDTIPGTSLGMELDSLLEVAATIPAESSLDLEIVSPNILLQARLKGAYLPSFFLSSH